jgi:3-hydroxybutyryl-CoA dehydrogenase
MVGIFISNSDMYMMKKIKSVGIIGAGSIGPKVAYHMSNSGIMVYLTDVSQDALKAAERRIHECTNVSFEGSHDFYGELGERDLVIECSPEILEVKLKVLKDINITAAKDAIITTPTSTMLGSELKHSLDSYRWSNFLCTHYLPGSRGLSERPVVELMGCGDTSTDVMHGMCGFFRDIGLKPYEVVGEQRGYLFNRYWLLIKDAALRMLEGGQKFDSVNDVFMEGLPAPIGPLQGMDLVGIQTIRNIQRGRIENGEADVPFELVSWMVVNEYTGVLSPKGGFYDYRDGTLHVNDSVEHKAMEIAESKRRT